MKNTIEIKVKYMGNLKKLTGLSSEVINLSEAITAYKFLNDIICTRHEELGKNILDNEHAFNSMVLVFHNDDKVEEETLTLLKEGDVITIIPPISGG